MPSIDLTPLYRSFIGSDHLAALVEAAKVAEKQSGYPPYNIELMDDTHYRITMAVAGFSQQEVIIETVDNKLVVAGKKAPVTGQERKFLHKGISERNFERTFQLGDNVKVCSADMENGLLNIDLERIVPEPKKARRISIGSNQPK
ncbi:Hsp20 family protein [Alteromonas sp. C1M14]|uniref:Hsp20 family protein n=1 Tax=Alteromonas sp. C1M14 TaxID=2841567 RepID=UPI001C0A62DE|nr:Hsp20 family protein [Alteromonas sp. C1M14]MBU2978857.1 Hsp20 family protein [Alteromonas sp. C1M14]